MTNTIKNRRSFLKATAVCAGTSIPLVASGNSTIPPIISLLLGNDRQISPISTVLEGEGNGGNIPFPENTVNITGENSTVEEFYKRFRPDFFRTGERELGFDELSVELSPAAKQEVTLTVTLVDGSRLTATPNTQTVAANSQGIATFSKVVIPLSDFEDSGNLITENHTFELRFSSDGAQDFVTQITFDLGQVLIEMSYALEGEGDANTPQRFFNGEGSQTFANFFDTFKPQFFSSGSRPEEEKQMGIDSLRISALPRSEVSLTLTAEFISGFELGLDPSTSSQTRLSDSFGNVSFDKILFTPQEFGPAGSGETTTVTTNHTIRLTISGDGLPDAVAELTLDFESGIPA